MEAGRRGWDTISWWTSPVVTTPPVATTPRHGGTQNPGLLPEEQRVWTLHPAPLFLRPEPERGAPQSSSLENERGSGPHAHRPWDLRRGLGGARTHRPSGPSARRTVAGLPPRLCFLVLKPGPEEQASDMMHIWGLRGALWDRAWQRHLCAVPEPGGTCALEQERGRARGEGFGNQQSTKSPAAAAKLKKMEMLRLQAQALRGHCSCVFLLPSIQFP